MHKQALNPLESRRLFSGHVAHIVGTSGDDNITISANVTPYYTTYIVSGVNSMGQYDPVTTGGFDIDAGDGNDTITIDPSFAGSVTIHGGNGNDTLIARGRAALMDGGAGNDTYRSTAYEYASIDESNVPGDLTITQTGATNGSETDTFQGYFYSVSSGAGNDHIDLSGTAHVLCAYAGEGDNYVNVGSSHLIETIVTGNGDDTIVNGAAGPQVLPGGGHNQILNSGTSASSSSSFYHLGYGVLTVDGSKIADQIHLKLDSSGNRLDLTFGDNVAEFDAAAIQSIIVQGNAGNDRITIDPRIALPTTLAGNIGNDTIYGGGGADRITGGEGNDWIDAGAGNDIIYGEAGNDRIFAGAGRDRVDGGSGVNLIRGQDGSDRIAYHAGDDTLGNRGDLLSLLA